MYTITKSGVLKQEGVPIPLDDSTPEYQAYVNWLADGNGPTLVDDDPEYPRITVTAWQLIQALKQTNLLAAVDNAANSSSDILVRMGWQRAPYFYSDEVFVLEIANDMGVPRDTLQELFKLASSL
jgi:hypothetical protein